MKQLLQIGMVISALLLAFLALHSRRHEQPRLTRKVRTRVVQSQPARFKKPTSAVRPVDSSATPWAAIESADPAGLLANLRAIGCPEQTVADILTFRICRSYRDRLLALKTEEAGSWDYTRNIAVSDQKNRQWQQAQLHNAMERELESLLGFGAEKLETIVMGWPESEAAYGFLSLEKKSQVRDVNQRYRELIYEAQVGMIPLESDAATDARIRKLNQQKQAELGQLLTAPELSALNLRESPAARYVLEYLPEAKSEEEFRNMVEAAESVEIEAPRSPGMFQRFGLGTPQVDEAQAEKEARLEARLKEVLGPGRFAEQRDEEQARQQTGEK